MSQNGVKEEGELHEVYALSFSLMGQNTARSSDAHVSWAIGRFGLVHQINRERPDDVFARSSAESMWAAVGGHALLTGRIEEDVFRNLLVSAALAGEVQEHVAHEAKAAMNRLNLSVDEISETLSPDEVLPRLETTEEVDPACVSDLLHRAFQNLAEVELGAAPLVTT